MLFRSNPKRWFYQAEETPGKAFGKRGAPYPRVFPLPQNQTPYHKTDLTVTACIDWSWNPESEVTPWQEAIAAHARLTNNNMIALGAEPITPPAPAVAAWQVKCLNHIHGPTGYSARVHIHTALTLGHHLFLTPAPGPAAGRAFVEHIRQHTIRRLRGSETPSQMPFLSVYPARLTP